MNKTQTKAQELIAKYSLQDNEEFVTDLMALLTTGKGTGSTRPASSMFNDEEYKYCRFTGKYWLSEYFVYQNAQMKKDNKDKGYTTIGLMLWNKGQKSKKEALLKLGVLQSFIIDNIGTKDKDIKKNVESKIAELPALKSIVECAELNNGEYLVANFLAELKEEQVLNYEKNAFNKEDLV